MSDWTRKRTGGALGVGTMVKDDTLAAGVAEVSVDRATGKIKVHNFWAAIDAGLAVQPRNIAAQTEGSVIYGLGHVLREKSPSGAAAWCSQLHRLRGDAHVRRAQYRDPGGLDRQSPDRRRRGRRAVVSAAVGNAIAALTGVRLHDSRSPRTGSAARWGRRRERGGCAPAGGGTRTFGAVARMSASDMREGQSRMTRPSGRASGARREHLSIYVFLAAVL